jgi:pimeloyl-ACP methyl ester carboxylesterase
MNLDITIHKGKKNTPVVILIHGLGMDKNFWLDPLNTKIFAKNIPFRVFAAVKPHPCKSVRGMKVTLGTFPDNIKGIWNVLEKEEFNLICWSQRRPVGPIHGAVEECAMVMRMVQGLFPVNPKVLIGHSRGGLIARKFMEEERGMVRGLITISTPHKGSSLAKIGKYLEPFSAVLKKAVPGDARTTVTRAVKHVSNLLEGNAWKELHPDSLFLRNLSDSRQKDVTYVSLGGSRPRLMTLYHWKKDGEKMCARPLFSVPDSLVKVLPPRLAIDEIMPGKGDGLVTALVIRTP